ncbi:MAG: transcription antitermination factor NusB, partial [Phycisphaeraceae bacterium]
EADLEQISATVQEAPFGHEVRKQATQLAEQAWAQRATADELASEVAPDWPTHRQPVVDRNLIRLAYHEMVSGRAPTAVAINEAIELAKSYSSERSPSFINGVLDRLARKLHEKPGAEGEADASAGPPAEPSTGDAWLDDAIKDKPDAE